MRTILRGTTHALAAVAILAVLAFGDRYLAMRSSLPPIDGRLTVSGLSAPVDIVRDRYGIPHIFGETEEDVLDWAFALRDLDVDSIPVNFLNSIEGTPLAGTRELKPAQCLRTLALARFTNPSKDIRVAGGREVNLRSAQSLALFAVNSIFTDGYLTTLGRDHHQDHRMIEDAGFEIEER